MWRRSDSSPRGRGAILSLWLNLRRLRSSKPEVRAAAVVRLGQSGNRGAVTGLSALLHDEQRALRAAAAQALGAIGHSSAVGPLVTALLSEKQWDVRYEIVDALRKIGDPKAVNELLVVLDGGSADVGLQQVTTWALKEFGWDHLTPAQQAVILALRDEWNEIPKIGSAAILPVLSAIKTGTHRLQMDATDALARMNEPRAVAALVDLLDDPNENIRRASATALERHAWTKLDETQSARVAISLGKWSVAGRCGAGAIDALIAAARDGSFDDRQHAIETLGLVGGPRAATLLAKALRDKKPETRHIAAKALGRCPGAEPCPELIAAIEDENTAVRSEAAKALVTLGWLPETPAQRVAMAAATGRWNEVVALGAEAIEPILAFTQRPSTRTAAFDALLSLGEQAIAPLAKLLKDASPTLRVAAADALGETGSKKAVDLLKAAIHGDPEQAVRVSAADALRNLRWQPADDAEAARIEIALERWAEVVELGPVAIAPLVAALDDSRYTRHAGRAIEEILRGERGSETTETQLRSLANIGEGRQAPTRASASANDPAFQASIIRRRLAQLARAELQKRKQPV